MDIVLFLMGAIGMGIYFWIKDSNLKEKQKSLEKRIKGTDGFTVTQFYIASTGNKGIAFDEANKKFAICSSEMKTTKTFSYQDILSAEIFYDGNTVTKTNRVSQIGGALIGGLALGGLGAVVGGLSGKKKSKKEIEKIELRIIVNDKESPVQDIIFLNTKCKEWTPLFKESEKSVRHWFAIVSLLINEADKYDERNLKELKSLSPIKENKSSLVESLNELNELFQKGILTEEEFYKAKQKTLNDS
ncbi:hypothetical protein PS1M3_37440 [Pseudoalteromonas sp. PS1M3]|jgi:hypothetical protein|uniref:SHOCT domain-containing protein n=1 Tax=Pseudoalteromonas sp. PS1M3 TaxID=87791 RepID=UPI001950AF77|nr:SHOCT domain-containing protein [Pseudoalteromonas sp. PS1M3]BBW93657.1 hypothetical protein PS1M3_37440 [Pseudoalteromonas sp. PS1M3]